MICAKMLMRKGALCGFDVHGHSGSATVGNDIICAAVSSAVYLVANTLTEVCGCRANITEADGKMQLVVDVADVNKAQEVLRGLHIHLKGLVAQYPEFITIQLTEV